MNKNEERFYVIDMATGFPVTEPSNWVDAMSDCHDMLATDPYRKLMVGWMSDSEFENYWDGIGRSCAAELDAEMAWLRAAETAPLTEEPDPDLYNPYL